MKVFVTGATGYIGSAVAGALAAAGHVVVGLARSEKKAREVEARGLFSHIGDLRDPLNLAMAAREAHCVVHAAMDWGPDGGALDEAFVDATLEAQAGSGRIFIYTSGVWVMGDTRGLVKGEGSALDPPAIVKWRPVVEKKVLDATGRRVRGIVIRPAIVYGRGGGMIAGMLKSAQQCGAAPVVGKGENHWSFVHIDDVSELYKRLVDKTPAGELYIAAAGPAIRVLDLAEAVSRAAGAEGRVDTHPLEEAREEMGGMADALALDQKIGSTKAFRQLGWIPRGPSLMEELRSGSYTARKAAI
ncbi:MAG: NAD-dependent epimerase/dehydratase family protein [Bryobacteraceae bacterium]